MSSRINHVSINARDLQESVDFWVELLGAEPIPTPNFGLPVQWLALGRTQLHLFERDLQPTSHHHLGIRSMTSSRSIGWPSVAARSTGARSTTTWSSCPATWFSCICATRRQLGRDRPLRHRLRAARAKLAARTLRSAA
jgi:hypothetical protein